MYVGWGIHHFRAAEACGVVQGGVAAEVQGFRHTASGLQCMIQVRVQPTDFRHQSRYSQYERAPTLSQNLRQNIVGEKKSGIQFRVSSFGVTISGRLKRAA